ncbi:hypothetical protein U1Q18_035875 [Sarracenia purpurea var. burkii]
MREPTPQSSPPPPPTTSRPHLRLRRPRALTSVCSPPSLPTPRDDFFCAICLEIFCAISSPPSVPKSLLCEIFCAISSVRFVQRFVQRFFVRSLLRRRCLNRTEVRPSGALKRWCKSKVANHCHTVRGI